MEETTGVTTITGEGLILNFCGPVRGWGVLTPGIFCCRAPTLLITNCVNTPPGEGRTAIGLCAGTNAFRVVIVEVVVVLDDIVWEVDGEGNWVRGILDAATLALDATLEMTVLRVERSRTEGRNLPVIYAASLLAGCNAPICPNSNLACG